MKPKTIVSLLPQTLPGWQQDGPDHLYGTKNLYDYIDGGAELYLSYGFRQVFNRIYTAPDQPDILVDIFDMINSKNAYGVFSHSREKENLSIGQGAQYPDKKHRLEAQKTFTQTYYKSQNSDPFLIAKNQ